LFSATDAEASVSKFSAATRPYSTYVLLQNVTYSTDPIADAAAFYGIGVMNISANGPGYFYGPSSWYDVPVTNANVMWYVTSYQSYGWHQTSGDHRAILVSLDVIDLGTTYRGIFVGGTGAKNQPKITPVYVRSLGQSTQPWWFQDLLEIASQQQPG
jgi:hypothetical protein